MEQSGRSVRIGVVTTNTLPPVYSLPSVCVCGAALDGPRGGDRRAAHRLCGRTVADVLRPDANRTARRRYLATPRDAGAPSTAIVGADRRTVDDKGARWRKARRAALAALATVAPVAHHELTAWEGAASLTLEARDRLRGELASMPAPLAYLIRLEASAFDRAQWKKDDRSFMRRAVRDPAGPIASATLSRVWETATLGTAPTSLLAVVRNAARWLSRGERRTGGAIGGKLDKANVDKAKERSRVAAGRIIDAMPARQRALIAERLADSPELLAIAERIADIQARAVDRDFTNAERLAIFKLRETLAKALAIS